MVFIVFIFGNYGNIKKSRFDTDFCVCLWLFASWMVVACFLIGTITVSFLWFNKDWSCVLFCWFHAYNNTTIVTAVAIKYLIKMFEFLRTWKFTNNAIKMNRCGESFLFVWYRFNQRSRVHRNQHTKPNAEQVKNKKKHSHNHVFIESSLWPFFGYIVWWFSSISEFLLTCDFLLAFHLSN